MRKTSARPAQPSPSKVDHGTITRLRITLLRVSRRLRQQAHSGITPSQLSALSTIERHGPLTLGDLASLENVRPPSVSRIVGALEGEGYVERAPDDNDRRIALVHITDHGVTELTQIRRERDAWLADRLDGLTSEERNRLLAALPVLERLLDEDGG
jgi:DNA-binding MarR family transcriptional regulator